MSPVAVPSEHDPDALRRAVLEASWRRDRRVARRRLAWRWTTWFVARYGIYILLLVVVAYGLWMWNPFGGASASSASTKPEVVEQSQESAQPQQDVAASFPAPVPVVSEAVSATVHPKVAERQTEQAVDPLPLKISAWHAAKRTSNQALRADSAPPQPVGSPKLHPEIWLHSKEP